jgi:hypothetical protein
MSRRNNKRYTAKERKAYYVGVGAGIGFGKSQNMKKAVGKMTKEEKQSFNNGFDDYVQKRVGRKSQRKAVDSKSNTKNNQLVKGAYNRRGRVNEGLVDDLHGPVVFFDSDFDFTPTGRIKGAYNADGFFEPD